MVKVDAKIAVVIPCFRVSRHILSVISKIGSEVSRIYVIDDCCPERSGAIVASACRDPRVKVILHEHNLGVGGAMITGYKAALTDGYDIVVKLDGDGQMDPAILSVFIEPILEGRADYVKGNRFYNLESLYKMPRIRLFGNAVLSFINKAANGYWNLMDPTNGYTAIHSGVLALIPLEKIEQRYFFESDMLFRLSVVRAVIAEIPMDARYADEKSSLSISKVALQFPSKLLTRGVKRIIYNYFLRDFNVASVQFIVGTIFLLFGATFGLNHWYQGSISGIPATTGAVMLSALPIILGFQLLLSAISYDVTHVPTSVLHRHINAKRQGKLITLPTAANR